jgi:hypothetical protein
MPVVRRTISIPTVLIVCLSLLLMQGITIASPKEERAIRAAFLGIAFEATKPDVERTIVEELVAMMRIERALQVRTPSQLRETLGEERLAGLLARLNEREMLDLAAEMDVDYIFAGKLANRSPDPDRTLLVGEFNRFDRVVQKSYTMEIVRYFHDFGEEQRRIHKEFVATIIPTEQSFWTRWPVLVVAAILVVGIVALLLSPGKTSVEGTIPPGSEQG